MKRLCRIILVDWYLFRAEEWNVQGNISLLGANGSGKSSFIDAIQLVLQGGNKTDWSPNAKAPDRKRARDIRGYSLGIVKDENAVSDSQVYKPRDSSLSRIVLVWKDDETAKYTSIGIAISARREDPQETIEGFFILEDVELRLADLVKVHDGEEVAKPYDELKAFFRHLVPTDNQLYLFGREPKHIVEQLMHSLGPAKRPLSPDKYRRALKHAVKLSGLDNSVSDFVRHSILDPNPLPLDRMKQSIESYRKKVAATEQAKAQIRKLEEISALYSSAKKHSVRRAGYAWCANELRFQEVDASIEELAESLREVAHRYFSKIKERTKIKSIHEVNKKELIDIESSIKADSAETRKLHLEGKRNVKNTELQSAENDIEYARETLGIAAQLKPYSDVIGDTTTALFHLLINIDDAPRGMWPIDPKIVDSAFSDAKNRLSNATDDLDEQRKDLVFRSETLRREGVDINSRLNDLTEGRSTLGKDTEILIAILAEHGIVAVPVCELVEVTIPEWQSSIESYLKKNNEALIVAPEQAKEAVEIYRRLKSKHVYNAVVVNTLKVKSWHDRIEEGTAASLIEGEDELAVKYLQRLLRGIRLIESTDQIMESDRALTSDGMFANNGGITHLRPRAYPVLGKGVKEKQMAFLQGELDRIQQEYVNYNGKDQMLKNAIDVLSQLKHRLDSIPSLQQRVTVINSLRIDIDNITTEIDAVDTMHLDTLKEKRAKLDAQLRESDSSLTKLTSAIGTAKGEFRSKNRHRHELMQEIVTFSDARHQSEQDDDFHAENASQLLESLEEKYPLNKASDYAQVAQQAQERSNSASKSQLDDQSAAQQALGNYCTVHPGSHAFADCTTTMCIRNEVEMQLSQIRDIGLHERENEVRLAMHEVQRVMRSDIAIRMRSNIEKMKLRFTELNQELRERPFSSDQVYSFTYSRLGEFNEFLAFVESANQDNVASVGGLFDETEHLNEHLERMINDDESERLADYRNYYHFDISIKDPETGIVEQLSRKIDTASGGEHRTPYYVAIGAAMASAYRVERRADGTLDSGIGLFLADEAFEKMDLLNTLQTADYLKSVGLQLFVAAPDDSEQKMRRFVDTVMFFTRDRDAVTVEVDYVTPAARQLLAMASQPVSVSNV